MIEIVNTERGTGSKRSFHIALSSVQGGVLIEFDKCVERRSEEHRTVMLSPTDAAQFVYKMDKFGCSGCSTFGNELSTFSMRKLVLGRDYSNWMCENGFAEVEIDCGNIHMVAPEYVVHAMNIAIKGMMTSLMFPNMSMGR